MYIIHRNFVLLVNSLDDPEMHTLIQSNEDPYQWSLYVLEGSSNHSRLGAVWRI
jgi:hypothetical protein